MIMDTASEAQGACADLGQRCARNCYNCPSCTSPLQLAPVEKKDKDLLKPEDGATSDDAYVLFCQYCDWSTLDISLQFNRPTKITEQINKARKARYNVPGDNAQEEGLSRPKQVRNHDGAFERLSAFYKDQLNETGEGGNPYGNSTYGSPANLARIMGIYGGLTNNALKKSRAKPQPMREAAEDEEGFAAYTLVDDTHEDEVLQKMRNLGWDETASEEQALSTPANYDARFNDELWPAATHLLAKRGKRCRACRQFIVRPDPKASGLRYRIRILAHSNIPRLSLKRLQSGFQPQNPSFAMRKETIYKEPTLKPYIAQHYILTLRNPVFETVKVTLATPATTPGRVASKVTILCPSFTIGAAGDQWDDALTTPASLAEGGRRAAMASLTGMPEVERQPEAGKVWEQTRNSTSVILEIVPGSLDPPLADGQAESEAPETEDDDILEIPVYVRVEWSADVHGEKGGEKEPRELGYWCVLGVGRIVE
jgi:dynactin-4